MIKRILLIRANELRHIALSSIIKRNGFILCEIIEEKSAKNLFLMSDLMALHFETREKVENYFFSDLVNEVKYFHSQQIKCEDVNSTEAITLAQNFDPDLIITFGCSILKSPWLRLFDGKLLGIHLGLSPYYKGAGTNFFPFVNNELGAVGYTLMKLNSGVDTGDIVHQSHATFKTGDNIHTVGSRLILKMFHDLIKIVSSKDIHLEFELAIKQPYFKGSRVYRKQDFTEKSLDMAHNNLNNKIVENHLSNVEFERKKFPLLREIV